MSGYIIRCVLILRLCSKLHLVLTDPMLRLKSWSPPDPELRALEIWLSGRGSVISGLTTNNYTSALAALLLLSRPPSLMGQH